MSKFDIIAEGYQVLKEMFERNTTRLEKEIKQTNATLNLMVDTLNQKIEDDKKDLIGTRQELKAEIQDVRQELIGKIDDVREELIDRIDGVKQDLGKKIDRVVDRLENHEIRIVLLEEAT